MTKARQNKFFGSHQRPTLFQAEFDLSSIANTIVGSSSITTTFYGTQAEADAGGSAGQLSSPYENINANNETKLD